MKAFILAAIFACALYFGTGGFIYLQNEQAYETAEKLPKNLTSSSIGMYSNKQVMICAKEQDLIVSVYPYTNQIPGALRFIITAVAFGVIGATGRMINNTVTAKSKLNETSNFFLIPLQGGIIGLIVLGISYAVPLFLTTDNITLKPITIVVLSLFGGIFYLEFYDWFSKTVKGKISGP